MTAAQYLLQRRSLTGWRPRPLGGKQMTYSKWITTRRFDTEDEAVESLRTAQGMYGYRVTFRGKQLHKK